MFVSTYKSFDCVKNIVPYPDFLIDFTLLASLVKDPAGDVDPYNSPA
jgi:hypothetical protein